mgnify:CR=1 FL=1
MSISSEPSLHASEVPTLVSFALIMLLLASLFQVNQWRKQSSSSHAFGAQRRISIIHGTDKYSSNSPFICSRFFQMGFKQNIYKFRFYNHLWAYHYPIVIVSNFLQILSSPVESRWEFKNSQIRISGDWFV